MTRPGRPFAAATLAWALTATGFHAGAQSPGDPPAFSWRPSAVRADPLNASESSPRRDESIFRTTLAPFSYSDTPRDVSPHQSHRPDWTLSAEAYTHAPVDVGGGVLFETPFGLRLGTGFGWIPAGYLDLVANVATSASGTDSATGTAVRNSVDGGTVWRSVIGIRPIGGFYLDAGYAQARLRGALTAMDIAPAAGVTVAGTPLENAGYKLHSTLHMWIAEVGWQTHVGNRVLLGLGAGVMGTLSTSTQAEPDFVLGNTSMAKALSDSATAKIDGLVERYGFVPTIHARLGFDFL